MKLEERSHSSQRQHEILIARAFHRSTGLPSPLHREASSIYNSTMIAGSSPIRILAVDDHPVVREGICGLVGVQPDMTVVAEAANGREAIQQCHRQPPVGPGRWSVDARLFGWKRIDPPVHHP